MWHACWLLNSTCLKLFITNSFHSDKLWANISMQILNYNYGKMHNKNNLRSGATETVFCKTNVLLTLLCAWRNFWPIMAWLFSCTTPNTPNLATHDHLFFSNSSWQCGKIWHQQNSSTIPGYTRKLEPLVCTKNKARTQTQFLNTNPIT